MQTIVSFFKLWCFIQKTYCSVASDFKIGQFSRTCKCTFTVIQKTAKFWKGEFWIKWGVNFRFREGSNETFLQLYLWLCDFLACTYYYPSLMIIDQVALNKSGLLLKIQMQSTQALQLLTKVIKTESIYKSY